MKRGMAALLLAAATLVPTGMTTTAHAVEIGYEGCTPGYWKNHTDNWQETKPSTTFGKLYESAHSSVKDLTLQEALQGGGGSGIKGASKILARAATAAWLNAAHEGLGYPWRRDRGGLDDRPGLVKAVNTAFESGDRDTMLALASRLDRDNNLGCTLN